MTEPWHGQADGVGVLFALARPSAGAGKALCGAGKAAHMDAAVTLMAVESLEAIAAELDIPPFDPLLTRRNIILRGAHLAPLIGEEFAFRPCRAPAV